MHRLPSTEGTLPRDGFDLHYSCLGDGEPLLLLAGGPGLSADYLQPVAEAFADTHRCILLHLRGTGRSRLPVCDRSTVNLRAVVEDIEALREELGISAWTVLGHSFGGMLAMAYAAAYPGRVARLVLAASGGMTPEFLSYYWDNLEVRLGEADRAARHFWSEPARVAEDPDRALREQVRALSPGLFWDRGHVPACAEGLYRWLAPQVMGLMLQSALTDGYDVRAAMRGFDRPALLVQGRQDALGEAVALETRAELSGSTLTFLDHCGHFLWWDQPESFYAAVRAFLTP